MLNYLWTVLKQTTSGESLICAGIEELGNWSCVGFFFSTLRWTWSRSLVEKMRSCRAGQEPDFVVMFRIRASLQGRVGFRNEIDSYFHFLMHLYIIKWYSNCCFFLNAGTVEVRGSTINMDESDTSPEDMPAKRARRGRGAASKVPPGQPIIERAKSPIMVAVCLHLLIIFLFVFNWRNDSEVYDELILGCTSSDYRDYTKQ